MVSWSRASAVVSGPIRVDRLAPTPVWPSTRGVENVRQSRDPRPRCSLLGDVSGVVIGQCPGFTPAGGSGSRRAPMKSPFSSGPGTVAGVVWTRAQGGLTLNVRLLGPSPVPDLDSTFRPSTNASTNQAAGPSPHCWNSSTPTV